ncbi:hypothetical protein [Actinoallomurus sp. NPDC050550]|uniref:hypothetical protein n=1 Tax=Actinoallomurus sp. NPDC050550 TaxID=3154937 RepID=UPI0033E77A2F
MATVLLVAACDGSGHVSDRLDASNVRGKSAQQILNDAVGALGRVGSYHVRGLLGLSGEEGATTVDVQISHHGGVVDGWADIDDRNTPTRGDHVRLDGDTLTTVGAKSGQPPSDQLAAQQRSLLQAVTPRQLAAGLRQAPRSYRKVGLSRIGHTPVVELEVGGGPMSTVWVALDGSAMPIARSTAGDYPDDRLTERPYLALSNFRFQ